MILSSVGLCLSAIRTVELVRNTGHLPPPAPSPSHLRASTQMREEMQGMQRSQLSSILSLGSCLDQAGFGDSSLRIPTTLPWDPAVECNEEQLVEAKRKSVPSVESDSRQPPNVPN